MTPPTCLDPDLHDRARRGDRAAQQQVARAWFGRMRRWALLATADPVLADEVVQDALLRFVRYAHTWQPDRPFGPWLRALVRNAARDRRPDLVAEAPDVPSPEQPDRRLDLEDTARAALAALAQLPLRQREVLDLCDWQGWSAGEAADALEIDAATVRVHLHRGRKRLREVLTAGGHDVVQLLREDS